MEYSPSGVPIIDLSPIIDQNPTDHSYAHVCKHISDACKSLGCFYIRNHGLDSELIHDVFDDFKIFFSQPVDFKMRFVNSNSERGYEPFETCNVNAFMGRLGHPADPVERYAFGPASFESTKNGPNIYPDYPSTLKRNADTYYEKAKLLSNTLMNLFSIASGAQRSFFYHHCSRGEHSMKMNYYPKLRDPRPEQNARFPQHTDCTAFTILCTDECKKALRVKNAIGDWIDADPIEGALFVNLGDFLQRWTNDRWKATVHKVEWPENGRIQDRYALVYFVQANPGTVIDCIPSCIEEGQKPKYAPISCGEYVNSKMDRLVGKY